MGRRRLTWAGVLGVLIAAVCATPAHAAKECAEPGAEWERATPAEAGFDAAKLQGALDYATTQASYAVRVYRHGCLVGQDRLAAVNRNQTYESWSMAKSVTSMLFGRAMTRGLIAPEDPVGSLLPEASRAHGAITMRDLLTMTSGLEWNGFRDYNVFTMPNRVHDALTLRTVKPPGTYYEYAQSAVALLAEAVGRSAGEDPQAFFQREVLDPIGIAADDWHWTRDPAGHIEGFKGVNMRPDDFGRLGELLRRGGVWRGRRILSEEYVRSAVAPSRTNGCYGWLIWVNAGKPCVGVRIQDRPVSDNRDMPDMPVDMYRFSGLFGQLVTVFPTQAIVVVRTGQDPGLVNFAGGTGWEQEMYSRILGAVTDQRIDRAGDGGPNQPGVDRSNADAGFQDAITQPDRYRQGAVQDPLPPAGPRRARAPHLSLARPRATRKGIVRVRLSCPPRGGTGGCSGPVRMKGARKRAPYSVPAGRSRTLRFRLTKRSLRKLRRARTIHVRTIATNRAQGGSTVTRRAFTVRR